MRTFRYMMLYRPKTTLVTIAFALFIVVLMTVPNAACDLPPCTYEDSDNCYWDADTMGNGSGKSFTIVDGVVDYE